MPFPPPRAADLPRLKTLAEVEAFVRKRFEGTRGSHDWEHTRRVRALCLQIARVEGADPDVLDVAAYLHDVGRAYQDESKGALCHAQIGADMAAALLVEFPLDEKRRRNVIHCIRSHRFRGDCPPQTLEACTLFDADKLDAIGAVGIARTFLFAGEVGAKLHNSEVAPENTAPYTSDDTGYREFKLKLCNIRDRMLTGEGRRMAADRHRFMERFFERFLAEYDARC
jgi:uncharacterized protein